MKHKHTGQSQYSIAVCLKEDKQRNTPKPYHHLIARMTGLCDSPRGTRVSDRGRKNKSEEGITSLPTQRGNTHTNVLQRQHQLLGSAEV